jgi:CxxC motif-containing protein (DUF1111 family)
LQGATVQLQGNATATTTTNAAGQYSFNVSIPGATGSFDIRVTDSKCTGFNPGGGFIALNNINGSRANNNFTGVGAGCVSAQVADAGNSSAVDPGPRQGAAGAGCAAVTTTPSGTVFGQAADHLNGAQIVQAAACCIPTLANAATAAEPGTDPVTGTPLTDSTGKAIAGTLEYCAQAVVRFQELDSVKGTDPIDDGTGLGPTYNSIGCAACHTSPGVLGSSPNVNSPNAAQPNPQILAANRGGATNTIPPFITANGPVREARFPIAGGGGVTGLFTIAGRTDTPSTCTLAQANFAAQIAANDIIFRTPTPTFGTGLIENTQEQTLEANLNTPPAGAPTNATLGISGVLNRSGNDGTITRFGWKAQNKSLLIFTGEAYNVEQGVSNEAFPEERHGGVPTESAACFNINPTPEDATATAGNGNAGAEGTASDIQSDLANFAAAMRLSAPPTQASGGYTAGFTNATPVTVTAASIANGSRQFIAVGCGNCHTPSLATGPQSSFDPALAGVTYHPYSDIAIHHMGTGLADGVNQGGATGDQFRSAPLWGVGQRIFFLHDGRTTNIVSAIEAHASSGSEGTTSVQRFNALSVANQQDLVNFLRSL